MGFKVRIEVTPDAEEEIIIKCKNITDEVIAIQSVISNNENNELELTLGENTHFVKTSKILFFETSGNKTAAHTKERMYYSDLKLYEL